jgi:hypothetical protein
MTDEELLSLDAQGFIPGPGEEEADFRRRVEAVQEAFLKLGDESIPHAHWEYAGAKLRGLFKFSPNSLPAFYSNRALTPWQGAAAWVERGQVIAIQLRKAFRKGSFLGIYDRDELLAHEAVHAARSAFPKDRWDEFFAYMTSERSWRQVLGPIVQRPWEIWPFLFFSLAGALFPIAFLGATLCVGFGFLRLVRGHLVLRRASHHLCKAGFTKAEARSLLVRLPNLDIEALSQGKEIGQERSDGLHLRLIRLLERKYGTKNHH